MALFDRKIGIIPPLGDVSECVALRGLNLWGPLRCREERMRWIEDIWYKTVELPDETVRWFFSLNREEWLVVLAVVCACGFVSLLAFNNRRL